MEPGINTPLLHDRSSRRLLKGLSRQKIGGLRHLARKLRMLGKMMRGREVFGAVVSPVLIARCPIEAKLALVFSVSEPMVAKVH